MHIITNFCHDVARKGYVLSGRLLEDECHHHKMRRSLLLPEIPQRLLLYFSRSTFKRCNHETFQVCSLDLKISLKMIVDIKKTCTLLHYNLLLHSLYWFYFYFSTTFKQLKKSVCCTQITFYVARKIISGYSPFISFAPSCFFLVCLFY